MKQDDVKQEDVKQEEAKQEDTKQDGKKKSSFLSTLIFLIALGVFCYAGWNLYTIFHGYHASDTEYKEIEEEFTAPYSAPEQTAERSQQEGASESAQETSVEEEQGRVYEDADPPLTVNWEELRAVNPDIVGWIYVDAFGETINYPVLRGSDNDYYLHHTFRKQYLFAGSIFENCENHTDFADPHTIVYGHNMKNASMFGKLKNLKSQEKYDAYPYFWILTPRGDYRYKIYAVMDVPTTDEVYTLFSAHGKEFLEWQQRRKEASAVTNDIPLYEDDYTVTLSTCTSNSSVRCVVIGKCISSVRPQPDSAVRNAEVSQNRVNRTEENKANANANG